MDLHNRRVAESHGRFQFRHHVLQTKLPLRRPLHDSFLPRGGFAFGQVLQLVRHTESLAEIDFEVDRAQAN